MFVRKLYYDLVSGRALSSFSLEGDVYLTTFAEDTGSFFELSGRTEANTGCMVWNAPDAETEANFASATSVSVDVTQTPHALVFDYTPIEPAPDPVAEMETALNELGVATRE